MSAQPISKALIALRKAQDAFMLKDSKVNRAALRRTEREYKTAEREHNRKEQGA